MRTQNEITVSTQVPSEDGHITSPGWARTDVIRYVRKNIKAPWFRKKEWDYYLFTNDRFGLAFTISDLGYIGLLSVSFLDFESKTEHTESEITVFPRGKAFGLGTCVPDAHGECHTKRLDMVFENREGCRHISCDFRGFDRDRNLRAELDIYEPGREALYIATPWKEKPTAFYYNCKFNCLEAEGTVAYGDRTETFTRKETLGVLDWGRGVWTYDNTWFWGTGSGRVGEESFGFNLGYGFSDRTSASENAVFYQGKVHKLSEVDFGIPKKDGKYQFLEPWNITSDDGAFTGTFVPIMDRSACMDYKLIVSDQHQVFGRMTGKARLEDGSTVEFHDFLCALEVVRNKY